MADEAAAAAAFGPNAWLVDDMYERYKQDPSSVAESWRDFFEGYGAGRPANADGAAAPAPEEQRATTVDGDARPTARPVAPSDGEVERLRGAAARIAANMEASLGAVALGLRGAG
jgi:2-oxoglutarate decarboxylase